LTPSHSLHTVSQTSAFERLLLAIPLSPSPRYREHAEGARYEPAGERVNPKKEATDRLSEARHSRFATCLTSPIETGALSMPRIEIDESDL
jgi:hypothetical protein